VRGGKKVFPLDFPQQIKKGQRQEPLPPQKTGMEAFGPSPSVRDCFFSFLYIYWEEEYGVVFCGILSS